MALIYCDECKNLISDKAVTCPHCGVPRSVVPKNEPSTKERELYTLEFFTALSGPTKKICLTNKRIRCIEDVGIFTKKSYDIPLNKITSVSGKDSLAGNLLGYGTIAICASSQSFTFQYVKNHREAISKITKAIGNA